MEEPAVTGELLEQEAPSSSTSGVNWSQLPADLLVCIFGVLEVPDIFTSGVVCRAWHASFLEARRLGICSSNPGPCLVFSSGDRDPSVATLHSLTTGKNYYVTMPDPPFRTRYIVGSSHGWLITADERSNLLLVNPATQAQIPMPPPETIANVRIRCNGEGVPHGYDLFRMDMSSRDFDTETEPDDLSWEEGRFYFYMRVVLSADPSSGNCTVMILHLLRNLLFFARVGDTHWTWINVNELCWNYHDVLYNDDDRLFYAIRGNGDVHAINTNGPSPILRVVLDAKSSLVDCAKYIVLSELGDLLQVWRYHHYVNNNEERRTSELVVYKVDLVEHKLVELEDFEGHALFIGFNSSFFLREEDFPMLTPNSVYCTDDTVTYICYSRFGFREVSSSVTGELLEHEAPPSTPGLDWSQLPADLRIRIFGTLEIPDIFSSGVVCRSWHASYLEARRLGICSSNPGPCLVFSSCDRDPSVATLNSLTTGKDYYVTMPDPPFRARYIVGSSHGWLITAYERSNLLLVNPATQAQITMPPPETIANVRICCNGEGVPDGYDLFTMDMSSRDFDTETEPDDLSWEEGRVGDTHWTWIDVDELYCCYHDVLYKDDDRLFYAIRDTGDVHAIDTNGPSPMLRVVLDTKNSLVNNTKYIVLSESGDLLQVRRYYKHVNNDRRTRELIVYKVDLVEQKLAELKDFDGRALFIGFNSSFFLRAEDFPMLTPNSVYCTDDSMEYIYCVRFGF
uniref:F-box domain-containing protein n=1 Tax=Oryza glumipatula TaxID=40148 RepID=A0A0D9Y7P9_9ORYZ